MPQCLQQYLGSYFCHDITNFNAANSEMFRVNTFVNFLFSFIWENINKRLRRSPFVSLFKVDGTSFSDARSLVTTAHLTREVCPRDLKYRKSKTNMGAQKLLLTRCFFSCLSEIGSKQKLSFGRQFLSNSVCVRKTLFVAQCPKFKARVSISVAINLDRDQ